MNYKTFFFAVLFTGLNAFGLSAQSAKGQFTELELDGPLIVTLVAGENSGIEVIKAGDLVEWEINGKSLVVMGEQQRHRDETAEVRITIADLQALETTTAVVVQGEGTFVSRRMEITSGGQSVVTLTVDAEILIARAQQQSILNLSGTADDTRFLATEQSILDAKGLTAYQLDVNAQEQSIVRLGEAEKLTTNATEQSVIVE